MNYVKVVFYANLFALIWNFSMVGSTSNFIWSGVFGFVGYLNFIACLRMAIKYMSNTQVGLRWRE